MSPSCGQGCNFDDENNVIAKLCWTSYLDPLKCAHVQSLLTEINAHLLYILWVDNLAYQDTVLLTITGHVVHSSYVPFPTSTVEATIHVRATLFTPSIHCSTFVSVLFEKKFHEKVVYI